MNKVLLFCAIFSIGPLAWGDNAANTSPTSIFSRATGTNTDLSTFLVDSGSGSVSAAGMLGIPGDSVTHIENVKGLTMALKGLGNSDAKNAIAISITPARTGLTPMALANYYKYPLYRLMGSLTIGYAQGVAPIGGIDYRRQAISLATSYYFDRNADPIVVHGLELAKKYDDPTKIMECKIPLDEEAVNDERLKAAMEQSPGKPKVYNDLNLAKRKADCREKALQKVKWNASQFSFSLGSGRIKDTSGKKDEYSLGTTVAIGLNYGFAPHILGPEETLSSVSLIVRRTMHEPVLTTLANSSPAFRNSSLAAMRYTIGSNTLRGLLETSRTNTDEVTASTRTFKRAAGIDYRISSDMWINLRYGKQRTADGKSEENSSLISLSYSPVAILPTGG